MNITNITWKQFLTHNINLNLWWTKNRHFSYSTRPSAKQYFDTCCKKANYWVCSTEIEALTLLNKAIWIRMYTKYCSRLFHRIAGRTFCNLHIDESSEHLCKWFWYCLKHKHLFKRHIHCKAGNQNKNSIMTSKNWQTCWYALVANPIPVVPPCANCILRPNPNILLASDCILFWALSLSESAIFTTIGEEQPYEYRNQSLRCEKL